MDDMDKLNKINLKSVARLKTIIAVPTVLLGFLPIVVGILDAKQAGDFTLITFIMIFFAATLWRSGVSSLIDANDMRKFKTVPEYLAWVKSENDKNKPNPKV